MAFACSKHLIRVIRKLRSPISRPDFTVTVAPARHGTDWRCDVCGKKAGWAVNKL